MGWWGFDVMEGDAPMDASIVPRARDLDFDGYLTRCLTFASRWNGDPAITTQVAAHNVMTSGRPLGADAKETVLAAIVDDTWAKTNPERKAAMDRFAQAVRDYDGTPWTGMSTGLIDTMVARADAGGGIETPSGARLMNVGPEADFAIYTSGAFDLDGEE